MSATTLLSTLPKKSLLPPSSFPLYFESMLPVARSSFSFYLVAEVTIFSSSAVEDAGDLYGSSEIESGSESDGLLCFFKHNSRVAASARALNI